MPSSSNIAEHDGSGQQASPRPNGSQRRRRMWDMNLSALDVMAGSNRNVGKTAHCHTARSKQLMDDHRFPARCSWSSMRTFTIYLGRNDLAAPWTSRFVVDKREAVP